MKTRKDLEGTLVSAAFDDLGSAESAARALIEEGFSRDRFSVLVGEGARFAEVAAAVDDDGHVLRQSVALDQQTRTLKGAGVGSAVGGTVGAVVAAVIAAGTTLAIPPLGIVVAGPIAAALAGAGAGGTAGTLLGALTGAGMSELRAKELERAIKAGRILLGVRATTIPEARLIRETLDTHGGAIFDD